MSLEQRDAFYKTCLKDEKLLAFNGIPAEAAVPFVKMAEEFSQPLGRWQRVLPLARLVAHALPAKLMEKRTFDRCIKEAYEMSRYCQEILDRNP